MSTTFEAAQTAQRSFSDKTIDDAIGRKLRVNGVEFHLPKVYFDRVAADPSDIEFMEDPEKAVQFRDKLSDFVTSHLRLVIPRSQSKYEDYVQSKGADFLRKVRADKQVVRSYLIARGRGEKVHYPAGAFDFQGFELPSTEGNVDLLDGNAPSGIRANLQLESSVVGMYLQWKSREYLKSRARDEQPELTRRIYLNPRIGQAVEVFTDVVDRAEAAGLHIKGKILDRSGETKAVAGSWSDGKTLRGDGIVFYVTEAEKDTLLSITEEIYKERHAAFAGRKVSRLPMPIGEGVAIGDDPEDNKESLASHRSKVFEEVAEAVRAENLPTSEARTRRFRALWKAAATGAGINPENPAFNTRRQ